MQAPFPRPLIPVSFPNQIGQATAGHRLFMTEGRARFVIVSIIISSRMCPCSLDLWSTEPRYSLCNGSGENGTATRGMGLPSPPPRAEELLTVVGTYPPGPILARYLPAMLCSIFMRKKTFPSHRHRRTGLGDIQGTSFNRFGATLTHAMH